MRRCENSIPRKSKQLAGKLPKNLDQLIKDKRYGKVDPAAMNAAHNFVWAMGAIDVDEKGNVQYRDIPGFNTAIIQFLEYLILEYHKAWVDPANPKKNNVEYLERLMKAIKYVHLPNDSLWHLGLDLIQNRLHSKEPMFTAQELFEKLRDDPFLKKINHSPKNIRIVYNIFEEAGISPRSVKRRGRPRGIHTKLIHRARRQKV